MTRNERIRHFKTIFTKEKSYMSAFKKIFRRLPVDWGIKPCFDAGMVVGVTVWDSNDKSYWINLKPKRFE